jgi:osmotically-inducible protein OsmY
VTYPVLLVGKLEARAVEKIRSDLVAGNTNAKKTRKESLMKKFTLVFSILAISTVIGFAQSAKPKHVTAPKTDSEVQSCIESKLATSSKVKDQGFGVSMNNGVATFTGTTKNSGSKNGVNGIARACGAKQVVNNITVEKATPAAAPAKKAKPKK